MERFRLIAVSGLTKLELTCPKCKTIFTFDMMSEAFFPEKCPSCPATWNGFTNLPAAFKSFKQFLSGFYDSTMNARFYQVASRKKRWLRYRLKAIIVCEIVYFGSAYLLARQGVPALEALGLGILIGIAAAVVLVKQPREALRIPRSLRQQVIARDLIAKGLKWDPEKYHIDHVVPRSRGGDTSLRNLRVIEKHRNLQKGRKMPRMRDFFKT